MCIQFQDTHTSKIEEYPLMVRPDEIELVTVDYEDTTQHQARDDKQNWILLLTHHEMNEFQEYWKLDQQENENQ